MSNTFKLVQNLADTFKDNIGKTMQPLTSALNNNVFGGVTTIVEANSGKQGYFSLLF